MHVVVCTLSLLLAISIALLDAVAIDNGVVGQPHVRCERRYVAVGFNTR